MATAKNQPKLTKTERIEREQRRLLGLFDSLPATKRIVAEPLIQNSAFMRITLEDLQTIINEQGTVDQYQNGENQKGLKQSATLQSYNSLIKNFANVQKQLLALVPAEQRNSIADKMAALIDE